MNGADEALRALQAELSLAPSPDFQARVRARIAQRRAPRFRGAWIVPAAAAALVAVGVLVWPRSQRSARGPAIAVESPAPPPSTAWPGPSVEPPAAPVPRPRHAPVRRIAASVRVLVPYGEAIRIARYAEVVRRRPFEADTLPHSDPNEPLAEPAAIEVAPLDTLPLVPDEGSIR